MQSTTTFSVEHNGHQTVTASDLISKLQKLDGKTPIYFLKGEQFSYLTDFTVDEQSYGATAWLQADKTFEAISILND